MNEWISISDEIPNCECIVWLWSDRIANFAYGYYKKSDGTFRNPLTDCVIPEVSYWKSLDFHYLQSPYNSD